MANYKKLVLSIAVVLIVPVLNYSGSAFADGPDNLYLHQHITAIWYNGMICGDHKCAPGEFPQYPAPVVPVREH